jgi:ABC-type phosphate transport system substrate-binding protein
MMAASAAFADVPAVQPAQQDTNQSSDLVITQGSDTTYSLHQRLSTIYNGSEGGTPQGSAQCSAAVNGVGSLTLKNPDPCSTAVNPAEHGIVLSENFDHDLVTDLFPTGSGNGINAVCNGITTNNAGAPVIGRSSRVRGGTDPCGTSLGTGAADFTFWGYAKDAVVPVIWNSLNNGLLLLSSLTQVQVQGIFRNCTITTWNQIDPTLPATAIKVYGVQSNSGTYATFNTYVGIDTTNFPNGANTCANLQGGAPRVLFENDASQVPAADRPDAIWFMSLGALKSSVRQAAGSTNLNLDGLPPTAARIRNGTFPTSRFLWMVARDVPTTDSQRAANDFISWVCGNTQGATTSHNSLLNVNYGALIDQAIGGFEQFVTLNDNTGNAGPRNSAAGTGHCTAG